MFCRERSYICFLNYTLKFYVCSGHLHCILSDGDDLA